MMNHLELIIFLGLLSAGYVFGRYNEQRHFRSILEREQAMRGVMLFSERIPPPQAVAVDCVLVVGSCVVAFDYFKNFVAGLRIFFGGRLTSYETLMERARREALLRMKAEAASLGSGIVVNVKIETSSVSGENPNAVGSVEVMVYGTALVPRRRG